MSNLLLEPPTNSTPQTAVSLAQRAPSFVDSQKSWLSSIPYPLSLFVNTESQEKWQSYENIFLACLRTGDDDSAHACLEALLDRFGGANDRILALQGLYKEATAKDDAELATVLGEYEDILKTDSTIFSIRKRRAALLRSMGRTNDAIAALTNILDQSPTDAETWSELGDLYLTQGSYDQAVFCFEEVLLMTPNSWNLQARLGEVLYLVAGKAEGAEQLKVLSESMRRFCRSLELCDNYLRGYYGLKLVRWAPPTIFSFTYADCTPDDHSSSRSPAKQQEITTSKHRSAQRRTGSTVYCLNTEAERNLDCKAGGNRAKECIGREGLGWLQRRRNLGCTGAARSRHTEDPTVNVVASKGPATPG